MSKGEQQVNTASSLLGNIMRRLSGVPLPEPSKADPLEVDGLPLTAPQPQHRSIELGRSAARPGMLTWDGLGQGEDTYVVQLCGGNFQARMQVHWTTCQIPQPLWRALNIHPSALYRWSVVAYRAGQPVGPSMQGTVWFLDEAAEAVLNRKEATVMAGRDEAARMLSLGALYAESGLYWEAYHQFRQYIKKHPYDPQGHQHLGGVCQAMGRLEQAAREQAQANRLRVA